ncbi:MAG TPA: RNA methyltransferase [Candidatus Saccharimonas sp.]|nr:RNA methyltransferase [Candidatus Saccharimonas sp.]
MITSKQNPAVKKLVALRRRREREQAGVTIIDGYEELSCALDAGVAIQTLYYCTELMGSAKQHERLQDLIKGGVVGIELSRDVFEKAAYREGPDGWLAVVPSPAATLGHLKVAKNMLILVCEAIEKPGNLGAMVRTADAAGVDAIISVDGVTDWANPNVIRASKGAVFAVPVANATAKQTYDWLTKNNVQIIASTPDTDALFTQTDFTKSTALCVGSEKYGHTDWWLKHANHRVRIPMAGKVNSLNVATSAALLVYEAVRQRATN